MATVEIMIEGEIGWDTTLAGVRNQYERQAILAGSVDEVEVRINSVGGDVDEGFAIHDYLRSLKKRIYTVGVGRVYSIATVILLAGDKREMYENAQFMIHNPWGFGSGTSDELRRFADELDRREDQLANFYSRVTGQSESTLRDWMNQETFFTADEAVQYGFIQAVIPTAVETAEPVQMMKAVAKFKMENSQIMSDTVTVDKGLWEIVKNKIGKALGHQVDENPTPEIVSDTPAPEAGVENDAPEIPDYAAQIQALSERMDALETEKANLESELKEQKESVREKDEALEMALAQMKQLEALPLGKAEKKQVPEKKEREPNQLDALAFHLDPNGVIFKR